MKTEETGGFQRLVRDYYAVHGRHGLPWRQPDADGSYNPYKITVSELMLQQTQVSRVIPKYQAFLALFPTVESLAAAPLSEVLTMWSGLGYNRRAKFLWQAAQAVMDRYSGVFPKTVADLITLPGIGPNTAGAIAAYAYNQPVMFIETNVRTVFIHHFFPGATAVSDTDIMPYIQASVPAEAAREWYWALMDYGTHLKQTVGNVSRASKTYAKQSAFQGSRRQVRGQVLRLLTGGPHPLEALRAAISDERLESVLADLLREELLELKGGVYRLRMV